MMNNIFKLMQDMKKENDQKFEIISKQQENSERVMMDMMKTIANKQEIITAELTKKWTK